MKHIAIIPNYSGITDMIKDGEIAPNFLVKSENDQKVYFSNAEGLRLVVDSGNTYNMYAVGSNSFEADFSSSDGFSFRILDAGNQYLTADFDWNAEAMEGATVISQDSGSSQNENHFVLSWAYGDTSWQVIYDPVNNLVQVTGSYTLTDEEACDYHGGTWDPVNQECVMPTCEEQGLCGDDPYDCHECTCEESYTDPASICDCEGKYWYDDECHDEPDPCEGMSQEECECVQQGGTWEGSECTYPEPDPCEGMEEAISECEQGGGSWDYGTCMCNEPVPDPCEGYASQEECECVQQGGSWEGSDGAEECVMPPDPCVEDPCSCDPNPDECYCIQQGGEWDGENCTMPSDEDPCEEYEEGSQEKCECQGRFWYDDGCHDEPEPEPSDPCDEFEPGSDEQWECQCIQQGGSWEGSECVMPSGE